MKAFKIVSGIVVLIAVLIVGAVFFVFGNLNQIVKTGVETVGGDVTESRVILDTVNIGIFDGRGQLQDFTIDNPKGFSNERMFELDNLVLQFNPMSLTKDVIVINEVTIEGMKVLAEQKGMSTNIQELLKIIDSKATSSGAEIAEDTQVNQPESAPIKLIVNKLRFADNSIALVTEKFGEHGISLPSFDLANLGQKEGGLPPEELAIVIAKSVLRQTEDAVKEKYKKLGKEWLDAEKEKLKAKAEAELAEAKAKAKEKLEKAKLEAEQKVDSAKLKAEEKVDKVKAEAEEKVQSKESELKSKLNEELGDDTKDKLKSLFR